MLQHGNKYMLNTVNTIVILYFWTTNLSSPVVIFVGYNYVKKCVLKIGLSVFSETLLMKYQNSYKMRVDLGPQP